MIKRQLVKGPIGLELKIMRLMWERCSLRDLHWYFSDDQFCNL